MSNSSEEFWEINGVSLNQYCWAIKTIGGSRLAVPKLRGDNTLYPFRDGRAFRKKQADSRVITLAMWVAGIDPDTDQPSENQKVQFNDNWKTLQNLLWSPSEQLVLTRRWWENSDTPILRQATALCELAGTMDPTMTGRTRADFSVDLLLSDPYFYGPEIIRTVEANETIVIDNPGDLDAWSSMSIEFVGELISPILTNTSTLPEIWLRLNTAVVADNVILDVGEFTVKNTFDDSNITGSISHAGFRAWMKLKPGSNSIKLTSLGNSNGHAVIKYKPVYL